MNTKENEEQGAWQREAMDDYLKVFVAAWLAGYPDQAAAMLPRALFQRDPAILPGSEGRGNRLFPMKNVEPERAKQAKRRTKGKR